MTRIALLAAAVTAAAAAASAQTPPNPDPAAVRPGDYRLETRHARILFSTSHLGLSTWYGDFSGATGTLSLDPKAPAVARLEVSIPVASVATTNAVLDGELKSAVWFNAQKYPSITFRSTGVTPTGPGTADVAGDLTFHGVTRPTVLHARFKASGVNPLDQAYTVGFEVTGHLKRSEFGVTTYVPMIGDDVDLVISAPFVKN